MNSAAAVRYERDDFHSGDPLYPDHIFPALKNHKRMAREALAGSPATSQIIKYIRNLMVLSRYLVE